MSVVHDDHSNRNPHSEEEMKRIGKETEDVVYDWPK
jgi:hypothetical protein